MAGDCVTKIIANLVFCLHLKSHFFHSLLIIMFVSCLQSDCVITDMLIIVTYLLTYGYGHLCVFMYIMSGVCKER